MSFRMTTVAPPIVERRILLRDVSWETYETLLRELEGQQLRLTYDRGLLEIMSPSPKHGKIGKLIARVVETFTLEKDIPIVGLGNTTWKSEVMRKGLEADECYYVQNAQWAAGRDEIDLNVDPPPDLAIEVDITSSSLDKQSIYAELGVPELWRHDDERLTILLLDKPTKRYRESSSSLCLPELLPEIVERYVRLRTSGMTDTAILAEFARWVRGATAQS
jgi:Uma2 family endonuclease